LLRERGRLSEGREHATRALAIGEASLGPVHPGLALPLNNLALIEFELGQAATAIALLQRGVAIVNGALGPDHPMTRQLSDNLKALIENS